MVLMNESGRLKEVTCSRRAAVSALIISSVKVTDGGGVLKVFVGTGMAVTEAGVMVVAGPHALIRLIRIIKKIALGKGLNVLNIFSPGVPSLRRVK
jgi:hypothetical protein